MPSWYILTTEVKSNVILMNFAFNLLKENLVFYFSIT